MTTNAASSLTTPTASSNNSPHKGSSRPSPRQEADPPPRVDSPDRTPIDLIIEGLRKFGRVTVPVDGPSMRPTLQPGERVRVRPVPGTGLRPGDVVAVRYRGRLVLHRVHAVSDGWVTTAGDNQDFFDPPMPMQDVVGVVPGLPPCPAPRRWPPGDAVTTAASGGSPPVTVWLVTDDPGGPPELDLLGDWQIKPRPAYGVGVDTDVLLELTAELAHRPCVVITERAVRTVHEVIDRPLPSGTQVVIGCSLGRLHGDLPGHLLPPELTDIRVRCGPPLVRPHPRTALLALARAVRGLPPGSFADRSGGSDAG